MRVVVVAAGEPWRLTDGTALILHHQLQRLAQRHGISLLIAGRARARRRNCPPGGVPDAVECSWFGTPLPATVDHGVRRVRSIVSGEPAHVHYVERTQLLRSFDHLVAERRPDVVHLHGWGTSRLAARANGVASVHFAVDPWTETLSNRILPRWRQFAEVGQRRKVMRHERVHYPNVGAVVVVTTPDADALRTRVPSARVEVIPNGVDPGDKPTHGDARVLVFHGAFETQSNVDAAVVLVRDVLPRVQADVPDVQVVLVGRDPPPEVRRFAGPQVTVTGVVADVRPYLEQAAVYVAPLVSGTGLKNKVLEAMAAGLPVVTTPLGVRGIGAGVGIRVAETPPQLAAEVIRLLTDPQTGRALGSAARQRVLQEFSWDANAGRLESLWQELATQ